MGKPKAKAGIAVAGQINKADIAKIDTDPILKMFDEAKNDFAKYYGQAISQSNKTMGQAIATLAPVSANATKVMNELNQYLGIGTTPEQSEALRAKVEALPDYQFRFDQGQKAIQRSQAAKGILNSGTAAAELAQYGQGMASQAYGDQVGRLQGYLSATVPAISQTAQAYVGMANNQMQGYGALAQGMADIGSKKAGVAFEGLNQNAQFQNSAAINNAMLRNQANIANAGNQTQASIGNMQARQQMLGGAMGLAGSIIGGLF